MTWTAIFALSAGSYGLKLFGVIAGQKLARKLVLVTSLLPAALFSALIIIMSVSNGRSLILDARLVGVAVGILAVWRKVPFILVVLLAMLSTAAVRLLF
tara:strand:- start:175 stop:471 length:297 start_codon:yes stop_codon:yes gene_type:complete